MGQNMYILRSLGIFFLASCLASCGGGKVKDPGYGNIESSEFKIEKENFELIVHPWETIGEDGFPSWRDSKLSAPVPGYRLKGHASQFAKSPSNKKHYWTLGKLNKRKHLIRMLCRSSRDDDFARWIDVIGPNVKTNKEKALERIKIGDAVLKERCAEHPRTARRHAIKNAVLTKLDKGVKKGKIKRVLTHMQQGRSGDFVSLDVDAYILLKGGWAIKNPTAPISDLNVKASKKLQADHWYKWRKKWGTYQIKSIDEKTWIDLKKVERFKPAKKKLKLVGTFDYASTSGSMFYGSNVSRGSYTFNKDRTYTSSQSSQFGGNIAMDDFGSVNSFSHCNSEGGGTIVAFSAPNIAGHNKSDREGCGDGKAGKYLIDGYSITFFANNGTTTRLPFYRHRDWIIIGSQYYAPSSE